MPLRVRAATARTARGAPTGGRQGLANRGWVGPLTQRPTLSLGPCIIVTQGRATFRRTPSANASPHRARAGSTRAGEGLLLLLPSAAVYGRRVFISGISG